MKTIFNLQNVSLVGKSTHLFNEPTYVLLKNLLVAEQLDMGTYGITNNQQFSMRTRRQVTGEIICESEPKDFLSNTVYSEFDLEVNDILIPYNLLINGCRVDTISVGPLTIINFTSAHVTITNRSDLTTIDRIDLLTKETRMNIREDLNLIKKPHKNRSRIGHILAARSRINDKE